MPWQKGQSGNPGGRKKSKFTEQLNIVVTDPEWETMGLPEKGKTPLRLAAEHLAVAAAQGEQWAIKELADRLDGKPAQTIDQTINDARRSNSELDARILELTEPGREDGTVRASGGKAGTNGSGLTH